MAETVVPSDPPAPESLRVQVGALLEPCRKRANLRKTIRIALVVGTILTLINQGDLLLSGDATALTAIKIPLNFVVPLIVSNLGVIGATRTAAREGASPSA